jgi:hypothetical protein
MVFIYGDTVNTPPTWPMCLAGDTTNDATTLVGLILPPFCRVTDSTVTESPLY